MLKRNQPMLLERMGKMQSATDVAEYCKYDGFDGLKRAISLSDEEILNELDVAHLRGRGGAAYPLGKKNGAIFIMQKEPQSTLFVMLMKANQGPLRIKYFYLKIH